jgi:stearoyl-CoA desaturase (delta-9 desaturase)
MNPLFKFYAWQRTVMTWLAIPIAIYAISLLITGIASPLWLIGYFIVYQFSMIALSVGNHRLFSHRAFKCNRVWHWLFAGITTAFGNGSTFQWITIHIGHHMHSDTPLDPHTVTYMQFFKLRAKSINFKVPYAKWALRDPVHRTTHKYAIFFVLGVATVAALISTNVFLFCYALPLAHHIITGNLFYLYSHNTEHAVDRPWMALLFPFAGEWNHKIHHVRGMEKLLNNAQSPWQFDPGYWFIKLIQQK